MTDVQGAAGHGDLELQGRSSQSRLGRLAEGRRRGEGVLESGHGAAEGGKGPPIGIPLGPRCRGGAAAADGPARWT